MAVSQIRLLLFKAVPHMQAKTVLLFFLAVLAVFTFGACSTARDIVAERDADGLVQRARELDYTPEAIEYLKLAIAIDSNLVDAWISLGFALHKNNRYGEAVWALEEALRLNPGHAYALYLSGMAHYRLREYVKARNLLREALAADPKMRGANFEHSAYTTLGRIALELDNLVEAEQHFGRALELEPNNWEHFGLSATTCFPQIIAHTQ